MAFENRSFCGECGEPVDATRARVCGRCGTAIVVPERVQKSEPQVGSVPASEYTVVRPRSAPLQRERDMPSEPTGPLGAQTPASPVPDHGQATARQVNQSGNLPTLTLVIVVTALAGVFGALVAHSHTRTATNLGVSTNRYWKAFAWTLGLQALFWIVVTIAWYALLISALSSPY